MEFSKINYNPVLEQDIAVYINMAIKKAIKEMQTCIPAIVKEVKGRNKVVVSPAVQQTNPNWDTVDWADIILPVYAPQGGNGIISMPVAVGDNGWIIAGDLDPSLFFQNPSRPAKQNVYDRHNYQYGFFLPAKMSNFDISSDDDGGIVIKNGDTKIVVKGNEIDIISNNELKINTTNANIKASGNISIESNQNANVSIDGVNFKKHKHGIGTIATTATVGDSSVVGTMSGDTGGISGVVA